MRPARLVGLVAVFVATALAVPARAQTVRYLKYTPMVLPAQPVGPLRLEAEITGLPTRVMIEFTPAPGPNVIEMRDDGAGGDRIAGDGTFTAELPSAPILAARQPDDVNRVHIGFLNIFNGATNVFRGNLFTDVYSSDAGTYPIVRPGQFLQATTRLVNIHDPTPFLTADASRATREFYRWFGDDYDVINLIYAPQRFANRTHSIISNAVTGIGRSITDNTAQFGSGGRLLGMSQFPIPGFFDGANPGHSHEFGHQWINFLGFAPLASGIPHWPRSTMATGLMGISIGGQGGQGGDFNCDITVLPDGRLQLNPRTGAPGYSDLDLYLMGLMPAGEVQPQFVFNDQTSALSCTGQTYTGSVTRLTADDVIRQVGPRGPAAGAAPTRFRVATVLVTRDELADPETMWLYSWMVDRAELRTRVATHSGFSKELGQPFFVATRGRGSLDMRLDFDGAPPDFALVPTPGVQTVTGGAVADFMIAVEPRGAGFGDEVTLSCGPLPAGLTCTFSPVTVVPGDAGATTRLSVGTRANTSRRQRIAGSAAAGGLAIFLWLAAGPRERERRPTRAAARTAAIALLVALAIGPACSGGPRPPADDDEPAPRPVTTYQVDVTATSGGTQHNTVVTVGVQ